MRLIAGPLNKQLLQNLLSEVIDPCTRVRAAVAYAIIDAILLNELPDHLTLFDLAVDPPALWEDQRARIIEKM